MAKKKSSKKKTATNSLKKSNKTITSKKSTKSKKTTSKREITYTYIFDANFFIAQKHLKEKFVLENLQKIRDELDLEFYISDMVYNELPFYSKGARAISFKNTIEIRSVSERDLEKVKQNLEELGIQENRHAQDPDLTLIALCETLLSSNRKVFLISDDFKLGENLKTLRSKIEFLSPSAFLLFISKHTKDSKLKTYYKELQSKVLKYNLEYMLKRKETYNPINKLMHLIENSVSISDDGFEITDSSPKTTIASKFNACSIDDLEEEDDQSKQLYDICNNYINTQSSNRLEEIILFLPLLDGIIISRKKIANARDALGKDQSQKAIKSLLSGRKSLIMALQESGSLLPKFQYEIFQRIIGTNLSTCEFLLALINLSIDVESAIASLNSAAIYATLSRNSQSVLSINYLKALVFIFLQMYEESVDQYKFTRKLAVNYSNDLLGLKCSIGEAIALFLLGEDKQALEIFEDVNRRISGKNLENGIIVFQELGDYFYSIGNPKIAISLYNEALEMAIDAEGLDWKIGFILDQLKKAYVNAMLEKTHQETINIESIIDKAHDLVNVDRFNEAIAQLSMFNAMLYQDLENLTGKGKKIGYFNLDVTLRESFDVVDILVSGGTSVLIAFNKYIGLLGFRVNLGDSELLSGIPENYSVQLKRSAQISILKPSDSLRSKYLVRGIIVVKPDQLEIKRHIPVFFTQMKI